MKKLLFTLFFSITFNFGFAQIFQIDSLPKQGILLDKNWKWHVGDNPDYAKVDFDDSAWGSIDPTKEISELPQIFNAQIKWLRLRFEIKNKLSNLLGLAVSQAGASEIYLNGHLIHQFGHFDTDSSKVKAYDPLQDPIYIPADTVGQYTLAVRYALQPNIHYTNIFALTKNKLFHTTILDLVPTYKAKSNFKSYYFGLDIFIMGVVFMLFVLHTAFYIYQKNNKTHLILAIYFLGTTIIRIFKIIGQNQHSVEDRYLSLNIANWTLGIAIVCLAILFYRVAKARFDIYFYIIVFFQFMYSLVSSISYDSTLQTRLLLIGNVVSFLVLVRLVRKGFRKKIKGFFILGVAISIAILGLTFISGSFLFLNHGISPNGYNVLKYSFSPYFVDVFFAFSSVAIPIGLSIFMGIQGSETNKELSRQLIENEVLKNKAIEQEHEKQQILANQNEMLEKQVTERTAELELKNRDLEIEAALDKIRSTSLAMHHSDEIENVVAVFFEKLKDLGLVFDGGTGIHIFSEGSKDASIWVFAPFQPPTKINLPYDSAAFVDNTIILDVWQAHDNKMHIFNKTYSFEEKNRYFNYVFKHNDFNKVPEEARNFILSVPNYTASFVAEKYSLIGANSWSGQNFSEADFEILKRVGKVFEQAYVRFLDLQKAETQAQDAQIEAALEKVRSRSLAMHNSDELAEAASILFQQVNKLGINAFASVFHIWQPDGKSTMCWANGGDGMQPPLRVPHTEELFHRKIYDAWQRGEQFFVQESEGEALKKTYQFLYGLIGGKAVLDNIEDSGFPIPAKQITHIAFFAQGYVMFNTYDQVPMSHDIFKRFGKVFEQTYTRFLDLQKAEAQAREAQIEVALERVRSKSMAMQHSNQLGEIASTTLQQLQGLGFTYGACSIVIMEAETGDMDWWISGFENEYPRSYRNTYFEHPFYLEQLNNWKEGKKYAVMVCEGEAKKKYDEYVFSKTDFVKIPQELQNIMQSFEKITFSNAYMKHGALSWSTDPLSDEYAIILQRFASVFEQSYTRFLDLQKAEAQAEQAKLDLVLIQTEKKRAEEALNILKATQTQLIQSEKLASLGELTAGIAHEIQNPLNFVNNFSELSVDLVKDLKDEIEKPTQDKEYIGELFDDLSQNQEKINLHGKRASSIVKGMLEHSRASTGIRELTDINKLADEYLRLSYHGLRAKDKNFNADFELIIDKNLPKINVIPQDIGRVLLNLINNAFQSNPQTPDGGLKNTLKVVVTTKFLAPPSGSDPRRAGGAGGLVLVSVTDNGSGMPESVKAKIFQPFFTTKPTGQGTGLGLSLAYDIITKGHGGTVEVESVEGEGTTFIVKLPIA